MESLLLSSSLHDRRLATYLIARSWKFFMDSPSLCSFFRSNTVLDIINPFGVRLEEKWIYYLLILTAKGGGYGCVSYRGNWIHRSGPGSAVD
jgi:hypothetical protein